MNCKRTIIVLDSSDVGVVIAYNFVRCVPLDQLKNVLEAKKKAGEENEVPSVSSFRPVLNGEQQDKAKKDEKEKQKESARVALQDTSASSVSWWTLLLLLLLFVLLL